MVASWSWHPVWVPDPTVDVRQLHGTTLLRVDRDGRPVGRLELGRQVTAVCDRCQGRFGGVDVGDAAGRLARHLDRCLPTPEPTRASAPSGLQ